MSTILRQATNAARQVSRIRNFSSSAVSRKDIVQDLYLREIKAYKPAPVAKDAHVGVVKSYSLPPAPKAPVLPVDLASELAEYDATEPTVAQKAVSQESVEAGTGGADEYLAFLEQDIPKPEAHHH
ncbi:ATP synthase complex subunit H-domain-containing protein [Amanita rubescens]|nr:ATP synthase complex subunit H-domain-containing protein [Amanita rubescens]